MKVYVKNSASILFLQVNSLKNGDVFILFCSIIVQLPIMKTLRTLIWQQLRKCILKSVLL